MIQKERQALKNEVKISHVFKRQMMTLSEVADLLRVEPNTLYRWANDGDIPAYKVGNSWRFDRDAIENWLRTRSNQPVANTEREEYNMDDNAEVYEQELERELASMPTGDNRPIERFKRTDPYNKQVSEAADYIREVMSTANRQPTHRWQIPEFKNNLRYSTPGLIQAAFRRLDRFDEYEYCTVKIPGKDPQPAIRYAI